MAVRIERTSRWITGLVIFVTLLGLGAGVVSLHVRHRESRYIETRRQFFVSAERLGEAQARLQATARSYAVTGLGVYLTEAREAAAKLPQLADELLGLDQTLLGPAIKLRIDEMIAASQAKLTYVMDALSLTGNDRRDQMVDLLFGSDFDPIQDRSQKAIALFTAEMDERLTTQAIWLGLVARVAGLLFVALTVAESGFVVMTLVGFYGRRVVNPLAELNRSVQRLIAREPGASIG